MLSTTAFSAKRDDIATRLIGPALELRADMGIKLGMLVNGTILARIGGAWSFATRR